MKEVIFLISLLVAGVLVLQAQPASDDKAKMEKERQDIQKEIQDLQGVYDKIKGQKNATLAQANVIKRKIALQEKYLNNINKELRYLSDDIYLSTLEINKKQRELDTLKAQYARSVVYAYKNRSTYDYLNFIFSANGFNDALKRIAYLKSYRSYREQQVNNIIETQKQIEIRKQQQIVRKDQKNAALQNQAKQISVLETQKKEKDVIVSELKSQEKDIQKQMALKKKRDNELKNALAAIVRREIEKEKEIARKAAAAEKAKSNVVTNANSNPATVTTNSNATVKTTAPAVSNKSVNYLDLNAKDVELNNKFELNRGKLPWPVDNGFVSIHYGTYNIEGTNLRGDNPGITISTPSAGVPAKAVFDGDVVAVFNLGDGMAVTIRHGKYFTTYSNLATAGVSKGESVTRGQVIGKVGEDDEGSGGKIDFILMIETKNVNPEPWLRK